MDPITITATLLGVLVKYGPEVYAEAVDLIHKKDPTRADYDRLLLLTRAARDNAAQAVVIAQG